MRVLVTVGSRHGGTAEIGAEVAQVLARAGHAVDLRHPDEVDGVSGYDAVVLGSAVYAGRVLPSVRALAHRCSADLGRTPVWAFCSGPVGVPLQPAGEPVDLGRLLPGVRLRGRAVFAGRLITEDLGPAERALVRLLGVQPGDYRDFTHVGRWAREIAEALAPRGSARPPAPVG